ncbi:MAG: NAD-dependent epimerase/dehydratase family protein [Planctomycetaceae bacterium]|nr:NAD-dependent epimerase/dehydratase family protein [Planctomycetaceae bacterium]
MKSDRPLRIGVVGCGAISEIYHLPALAALPATRNGVALAEASSARLEKMAQKFQAAFSTTDYQKLVGNVDGVIIATPPHCHYAMTKFFLENGVPVLCEKPLTESGVEARELVELSRNKKTPLLVNQTRRFFPTYQKIRELIAAGVLGKLESITYHDGVDFEWPAASPHHFKPNAKGAWSDTGVHLLDSVCYWLNAKPRLVQSLNDSCGGPEAMTTVLFDHEGCRIELKISRLGRLSNTFQIVGSLGSIDAESEDWDEITVQFRNGTKRRYKCGSNKWTYPDFAKPMLQNFVDVIRGEAEPMASAESVVGTIELLEEAYERPVHYEQPWNDHFQNWSKLPAFAGRTADRVPKVLVTGVSGFVGGRVVEAMALTGLFEPVCAVRNWSRCARVAVRPVSIVACDIMNAEQVDEAVRNVDAIVHCAYTDDRAAIVEGTRHLLDAAAKHGVRNFVYLSSAEVYGPTRAGNVDESVALTALGRSYGDAKLEAEQLCATYSGRGVHVTTLRPSLICGPYGVSWSIGVVDRLQSGKWGIFEGFGEGFANLVHVDDLVQAIFLALEKPADHSRVYNVNGSETPTWNHYFREVNRQLGLPDLQPISAAKSKWNAWMMDKVRSVTGAIKARFQDRLMEIYLRGGWAGQMMKRLKKQLENTPSGGELQDLFTRQAIYKDDAIRRELGYQPAFGLERGIASTLQWMILHELVRQPKLVRQPSQKAKAPDSLERVGV